MKFKENSSGSLIKPMIFGILVSLACVFLLSLISAFLLTASGAVGGAVKIFSVVVLGISAFIGGVVSSKIAPKQKLMLGLGSGALFYLTVALISVAVTKNPLSSTFIVRLAICTVAAVLGALLTVFLTDKNKYI